MEQLCFILVRSIMKQAEVPPALSLLVVFSNRLHLYNVRVVVNDLPPVLLMLIAIKALMNRRYCLLYDPVLTYSHEIYCELRAVQLCRRQ